MTRIPMSLSRLAQNLARRSRSHLIPLSTLRMRPCASPVRLRPNAFELLAVEQYGMKLSLFENEEISAPVNFVSDEAGDPN